MDYEDLSNERKELIAKGKLPEWFITPGWSMFKEKYLWTDSPLEQYRAIASTAAKYFKGNEREMENIFFNLMWSGKFSPPTPMLSNMGRGKAMPVSCLTGDQWIHTKEGGVKTMADVEVGDFVLTHKGRYRKVTNKQQRESEDDLYLLKVATRMTPIKITGNHPVLTNLGWVRVDELDCRRHWIATNNTLDTKEDIFYTLTPYKYISGEIPPYTKELPESLEIDEDLAWALGLWFADGSLNRYRYIKEFTCNGWAGRTVRITMCKSKETHIVEKWAAIMSEKFGVNYTICPSKRGDWISCNINSVILANYFGGEFGLNCKIKYVPREFFNLPNNLLRKFLEGFYTGDGRKSSGDCMFSPAIRIANPKLAAQLYEMSLLCGLDVSLSLQNKGRDNRQVYTLMFFDGGLEARKKGVRNKFIDFKDGNRYCRFDLEKLSTNEVVYDITVEEDESFTVAGVLVHNCSGQAISDSIHGFYSARLEAAVLTQNGFGTSGYFGDIRPRGSDISGGGKASGTMPVMIGFTQDMQMVRQGTRRGAFGGYLPITHGDFDEWADKLHHDGDKMNVGWVITDEFIESLNKGDEEAVRRYKKALFVKAITGKGYFFFVDKANRHSPPPYKNNGLKVKASNLCVAPETLLLTDEGYKEIQHLEGEEVTVWNGKEWSKTKVVMTGRNQELITVRTNQGHTIDCTPYHKFYLTDGPRHGRVKEVRACELKPGDRLIKFETPVIEGSEILDKAYENGFYSGDGSRVGEHSRVYLYGEKINLFEKFSDVYNIYHQPNQDRMYFNVAGLKHKYFVPDCTFTIDSRIKWLAGLLDSDGCVLTEKMHGSQTLQIASAQPGFLEEVQLVLQTMGVQAKVTHNSNSGDYLLPANDGSGELKRYSCRPVKRLLITGIGILQLLDLGLMCHRLELTGHVPNRDASGFITIKDITYTGRISDVYCLTEPKRHMCVFNGILTGQCSEITLYSDGEHSFSCILGAINLAMWPSITGDDIYYSTFLVHAAGLEFLRIAEGMPGMEKVINFTKKSMALGIGQMGLHTLFQMKNLPIDSLDAMFLNKTISETIQYHAHRASGDLAKVFGEPEWCEGTGKANTHLTACMPTKSTSLVLGGVSEGINPDAALVFNQAYSGGEIKRVTPVFLQLLKKKGLYNNDILSKIKSQNGSIQNMGEFTPEEKLVFRTAFEIDQMVLLRLAAQRQAFVDQSQSINLFFSGNASEKYFSAVHKEAFENEMIHSLYYVYSTTGVYEQEGECTACQ